MCYTNIVVINLYNIKEDSKMKEEMITLATKIQFSEERLEEIFAVPKTKTLFDEFMQKEENVKKIEEFNEFLKRTLILEEMGEEERKQLTDSIIIRIKIYILSMAIGKVINGKALNQAVCDSLKEQIKNETNAFDYALKDITDQLLMLLLSELS